MASTSKHTNNESINSDDGNDDEAMDCSSGDGAVTVDGIRIPPALSNTDSVQTRDTRLIITKITNSFFKSYADGQVLGPFHKCFNAIVGPNGSGKSNVIDSMLFVFGYRASKIRSKKVSVLIHNSENFLNVQSCTVSITFVEIKDQSGDNYEIVPNSEIVVSRTAFKDNSSFYQLNGRRVQFKEVATLLKQHGIDLDHNRFLILQGEVEQVAMMKPKADNDNECGMLEYLEDIIGTSIYKKPLNELKEREEVLVEQCNEKANRLKLIRDEVDQLRGPMEEAVEFLKNENKAVGCRNFIYQKNIHELEQSKQICEGEMQEVTDAHQLLVNSLQEIKNEESEKEAILKASSIKCNKLDKKMAQLKAAFNNANNKDVQLQADLVELNNKRKKYKQQLVTERKNLTDLEKVPEKNKSIIAECEVKVKELQPKKEKLQKQKLELLKSLQSETKELQLEKDKLETDLVKLKTVVNQTKSEFTVAEYELTMYGSSELSHKTKLEDMQATYTNVKEQLKQRTTQLSDLKRSIQQTEQSLIDTRTKLNQVNNDERKMIDIVRKKRASLIEVKSTFHAKQSRSKVLEALMAQKRNGNCSGLFGRLGDLGAIDEKYDIAVSTACGPLDDLVTDTVATAQWCIEYLRKYDVGRATFIILEKQEHLRVAANSTINTPEQVHRLYDLIQVQDEKFKTAFYYSLRDTLVADNLEQARRIAYGARRYRVVTLGGELIETSGTMSGGGNRARKGRMVHSIAACTNSTEPGRIDELQVDLNNYEQQLNELQQNQVDFKAEINRLEPQLRTMKSDLDKASFDLQFLKEQASNLPQQLKQQESLYKSNRSDPAKVNKLQKIIAKKREAYEEASEATKAIQAEVDKLKQEINAITSGKLDNVDRNITDVTKMLKKCEDEIVKMNVGITTSQRNLNKCQDKIVTLEQDIEKAETRLREMQAQREEIEADAAKLLICVEELTQTLMEEKEQHSGIQEEVAELKNKRNKLKSEQVDVDQKLKVFTEKLNDFIAKIHHIHAKVKSLKLQEIPLETVTELKTYTPDELESENIEKYENELHFVEGQLKQAKPNLTIIKTFRAKQDVYVERSNEYEKIVSKKDEIRTFYNNLKQQRQREFLKGYEIIRLKLKEMYQMLTIGGDADFEITDSFDPFSEGIQFNVRPPKKSWKKISNLSGGEKTLSSLALVFALHYYKPSPLYVMDEIDAALDFKNVSVVGHYIKERTKDAQFIIISLRSNMFELCDNLVGIYKTFNCTKTVCIDPRIYDEPQPIIPTTTATENHQEINGIVEQEGGEDENVSLDEMETETNSV